MAKTQNVRISIDPKRLNPYLHDVTSMSVKRAAERVAERAQNYAPYRTGRLRESITPRKAPDKKQGLEVTYLVGPRGVAYGVFQERGTGPIVPKHKQFLRFIPKGGTAFVFTKRTKGVPAVRYMEKAYNTLSINDYL